MASKRRWFWIVGRTAALAVAALYLAASGERTAEACRQCSVFCSQSGCSSHCREADFGEQGANTCSLAPTVGCILLGGVCVG